MINKYDDILDTVIDINKEYVVITGFVDIVDNGGYKCIKGMTTDSYYILIGNSENSLIMDALTDIDIDIDFCGEYEIQVLLRWYSEGSEYHYKSYLEVEHVRYNFIQTFEQRDREYKLNELLCDDFDKMFNIN